MNGMKLNGSQLGAVVQRSTCMRLDAAGRLLNQLPGVVGSMSLNPPSPSFTMFQICEPALVADVPLSCEPPMRMLALFVSWENETNCVSGPSVALFRSSNALPAQPSANDDRFNVRQIPPSLPK